MTIGQVIFAQHVSLGAMGVLLVASAIYAAAYAATRQGDAMKGALFSASLAFVAGVTFVATSTAIANAPVAQDERTALVCVDAAGNPAMGDDNWSECFRPGKRLVANTDQRTETVLVGQGCEGPSAIAIALEEDMLPKCKTIDAHILVTSY